MLVEYNVCILVKGQDVFNRHALGTEGLRVHNGNARAGQMHTLTLFHLISLSYLMSPTHLSLSSGQVFHYVSTL